MITGLDTRDVTMIKSLLGFALLFCLAVPIYAQDGGKQMFRWTDENGVVHFSDQRPSGQDVSVIDIPDSGEQQSSSNMPPPGEVPAVDQSGSTSNLSPADQRREEMDKRREEILAAREENQKACSEALSEVARLEPNRRVYFTNEQGEVERMDDVVRTDTVAELKAFIAANCK